MKKFKILLYSTAFSLGLIQPCKAILSETQQKMQKFIVLTAKSSIVSSERCVRMLRSYLSPTPTYNQILEISEYFKYFIYTLYPRKLNIRDYNVLFTFYRELQAFGLPENLNNSIYFAIYNLPINWKFIITKSLSINYS